MVVGGEGGRLGGGGGCLSVPYTRYKFRSLPPVSRLSQFVCVVFFGGGGRGAWEWAGVGGIEKAIESFQIFHYPQAFIHISKYENIDSDTESVFTLDSAFKISRHATKPNLMGVCVFFFFFLIHYLHSRTRTTTRTRFDLKCFREFSENIQRKVRKVIFIEGG